MEVALFAPGTGEHESILSYRRHPPEIVRDADSRPGRPVFNRTVGLRDTWAKMSCGA